MVLFGLLDFYIFMSVGPETPQIDIDALKRKKKLTSVVSIPSYLDRNGGSQNPFASRPLGRIPPLTT